MAQFRKKSISLFYKISFNDDKFKESFFLKKNIERDIKKKTKDYVGREEDRGINAEKKRNIQELFDLIPTSRRKFFNDLKTNESADDLISIT